MTSLPTGIKIQSIESPNGTYIMNIYRIDGGSIRADAIRGEIETIENYYVTVTFDYCVNCCN